MEAIQDELPERNIRLEKETLSFEKKIAICRRHFDDEVISVCDARGKGGGFCVLRLTLTRAGDDVGDGDNSNDEDEGKR